MGTNSKPRSAQGKAGRARDTKPTTRAASAPAKPAGAGLLAELPAIVSRDEAATALRVSTRTIDRLTSTGRLPALRGLGRSVRFARSALEALVAGSC